MRILATLTNEQRKAVTAAICPCCSYGIPAGSISKANGWYHYHHIDGQEFPCKAQALNEAIFAAQRVMEAEAERDRELLETIA